MSWRGEVGDGGGAHTFERQLEARLGEQLNPSRIRDGPAGESRSVGKRSLGVWRGRAGERVVVVCTGVRGAGACGRNWAHPAA